MTCLYLVDAYNVILQDTELNEVLDYEGLAAARRAMRDVAESFARHSDCHVRLVYDGAQNAFSHSENFENRWVEVSFTSDEEKADERVVAVALECARRGLKPVVVSDDIGGVREPLESRGFALLSTRKFASLLRSRSRRSVERRGEALSETSRRSLEEEFLARDAESRSLREMERKNRRSAAPPPPRAVTSSETALPGSERSKALNRGQPPSTADKPSPAASPVPARTAPDNEARRERGLRKQARRLALLQSRRRK